MPAYGAKLLNFSDYMLYTVPNCVTKLVLDSHDNLTKI